MYVILLVYLLIGQCNAGNILLVLPLPYYSHVVPFLPIFKELGNRGHEITAITVFTEQPPPKGFKYIQVNITTKSIEDTIVERTGPLSLDDYCGPKYQLRGLWPFCDSIADTVIERTKDLLPSPSNKYDLVVVEPFFCQEYMLGLGHYYNAPMVTTLPGPMTPAISYALGNPQLYSYTPNVRLPLTDHMNFLQRVWNVVVDLYELVGAHLIHFPRQDKFMRKLLPNSEDMPYITNNFHNISLLLSEVHFSMNYPRPYFRNVIEVGGISVKTGKPLSKDLEKFMNEAKDGVIYFSWGSHYEDVDPEATVTKLMKTFAKLKQKVVFKWFNATITNIPDNVLVQTWVPQTTILAHKNMALFISHCGLNSAYEAAYFGIPVVGTPVFGDQFHNTKLLESFGMAVSIKYEDLGNGDLLYNAINKVLSDQSFRENAKNRGVLLRDRPMPVVEEAAYWIEYVMRHSGGKHIRPVTLEMPWYSVTLIDIYLFLFSITLVPIVLIYFCINKYCSEKRNKTVLRGKKDN